MRARLRTAGLVTVVAVGALALSGGPLLRVRTWWDYDDPLDRDGVVVAVRAVIGLCGAAALLGARRRHRLDRQATVAWALLVLWLVASTAWSIDREVTLRESLLVGATFVAGAAAASWARTELLWWGVWIGIHAGLAWSAWAIWRLAPGTQDELGSWTGVYFNRNSLALVAAAGVVVSARVLVVSWATARAGGRRGHAGVIAGVGAVGVDLLLVEGSGSLTPLLALGVAAVAVGAFGWLGPRAVRGGRRPSTVGVIAGGGVVVLAVIGWLARGRLADAAGRSTSLSGRSEVWGVAWRWSSERPLVGHGYLAADASVEFQYEVFQAQGMVLTSAHSSFVDVLMGAGAIGLVMLLAAVLVSAAQTGGAALHRPGLATSWVLAVVVFVVVEHAVETLLVGGHLTVALLGSTLVRAAPPIRRDELPR